MKIKWLGHASFLITSQDNKKIITDPYNVGSGINYKPIDETADIVTVSHEHGDHNNVKAVKGNPAILRESGVRSIQNIEFKAIPAFHDEARGSKRGNDLIFCFKVDEINICHLGDLGHPLSREQLSQIGPVDVLFIPVGGFFTIDAGTAGNTVRAINPVITIPMHYKTPQCDYPISTVDEFLKGKGNVRRLDSSEIVINKDTLPAEPEILVLQPAI